MKRVLYEKTWVGHYLEIQLQRFVNCDNQVIKNTKHVRCAPKISAPVKDNVTYLKDYRLIVPSVILET